MPSLLHYRAWHGEFHDPAWAPLPIARVALAMMFRRKLFWTFYGFSLLTFLMFFFGLFLLSWAEAQASDESLPIGGGRIKAGVLMDQLRNGLKLNGTGETYRNYFWFQGSIVIVVLAMAGALVVGNDFRFGSLPFYLSKPLAPWHYVLGKCLAIAAFINLMTTLPALVLFVQYRCLYPWGGWEYEAAILGGILGYGLVLTVVLSILLMATASWLRTTVPLIMAWTTLFFFLRQLTNTLVDGLGYDPRWRLFDLWNNTYLVGNYLLGLSVPRQPQPYEAALVLGATCLLCLTYLNRRIRAVEVVQ